MAYYLANTARSKVGFYYLAFKDGHYGITRTRFCDSVEEARESLLVDRTNVRPELDLDVINGFGTRVDAKLAAMAIGLKTWRYVKI